MPISITCECGKKLTVKDELAGKRVRCPGCQAVMTVAAAKSPAAAPAPKANVGAPQKNGPAPRAAAPAPPPVDEEEERQEEEPEEKPLRRRAAQHDNDDEQEDRPAKRPPIDEEEEHEEEDEPAKDDLPQLDEDDLPQDKKTLYEDLDEEEDLGFDELPRKKGKVDFEDDGEEEEPVSKKKPAPKEAQEDEEEEEEEEQEEEERPKGKKPTAKKVARDDDEDERPKKGKSKERAKGKSRPEVPPALFGYSKFIVKAKGKGLNKTFAILDADSNEEVASAKNTTPFFAGLMGAVVYQVKDEATNQPAFTVGRSGLLLKKDQVIDARGRVVGRFKSKILSLAGGFNVYDMDGKQVCQIKGKLLKSEYKFLSPDGDEMGSVSKTWGGAFKSALTGAGTYGVKLEPDFADDNQIKMIILAAAIAVETLFQPKKKKSTGGDDENGGGDDE